MLLRRASAGEPGIDHGGDQSMALHYGVLGPLVVVRDGRKVVITAAKPRTVLARLVMDAPRTVPAEELQSELWGTRVPCSASANLRTYVCRLRQALGGAEGGAAGRSPIIRRSGGYALELSPDRFDVPAFRRLAAAGRSALTAVNPAAAVRFFDQALALWRGRALEDVDTGPRLAVHARTLDEERCAAIEDQAEARIRLGHHAETVATLRHYVADFPLRERAQAQLMIALYRCGAPAAALDVFSAARRVLDSELGIGPGTALRSVQHAILTQEPWLDARPEVPTG